MPDLVEKWQRFFSPILCLSLPLPLATENTFCFILGAHSIVLKCNYSEHYFCKSDISLWCGRNIQKPQLSDKEQEEKARRCEFVQGLLLSTILEDSLWELCIIGLYGQMYFEYWEISSKKGEKDVIKLDI